MTAVDDLLAGLTPSQRAEVARQIDQHWRRQQLLADCPSPLDLAARLNPRYRATPAHERINEALVSADAGEHLRWIITMGSQLGKSELVSHYGPLWSLLRHPEWRYGVVSYQQGIAGQQVEAARRDVESFGQLLGVRLSKTQATKTWWRLDGHRGGILAVGVGSGVAGRPFDWLGIDDPYADQASAASAVTRASVRNWYDTVAVPRLGPLGVMVLTHTRWLALDLAGALLDEEERDPNPNPRLRWRLLNFPARAGGSSKGRPVPDALGRQPGEWLATWRGHELDDGAAWRDLRREVGAKAWAAIYMGDPLPDEGGLFDEAWLTAYRVRPDQCPDLSIVAVAVDPAVTGTGDEAGIVAGGSHRGHVYVTHDRSGLLSEAGWSRVALLLALDVQADRVVYEANRTPEGDRLLKSAWRELTRHATALRAAGGADWAGVPDEDVIERAALSVVRSGMLLPGLVVDEESPLDHAEVRRVEDQMRGEWRYAPWILAHPQLIPFRVIAVHATRGKAVRAAPVAQAYETGRVHHVGELPQLEDELVTWTEGSAVSPGRLDACLTGDALVLTIEGERPIRDVQPGDQVWTRQGWRPVTAARMTQRNAVVVTLTATDGRTLTGTPDHLVWTEEHGFTRLDSLVWNDRIQVWKTTDIRPSSSGVEPDSLATQIRRTATGSGITPRRADPDLKTSTARSGSTTTGGPFPTDTTSTTPITTRSTTSPTTSSASPRPSTPQSTLMSSVSSGVSTLLASVLSPLRGTRATRVGNGTAGTLPRTGPSANPSLSPALSAESSMSRWSPIRRAKRASGTAPGSASIARWAERTSITWKSNARCAANHFGDAGPGTIPSRALSHVVTVVAEPKRHDVYDLTVADAHEFVANGVLVHNCVWLVTHLGAAQPATVQRPPQRGPLPTRTAGMGRR